MFTRIRLWAAMPLSLAIALQATAQTLAGDLVGEQLKALVTGKTWAVDFTGSLTDPNLTSYWDFKPDGSICGRLRGSKAETKCADTGKWQLQGNTLCWEFQWLGGSYGYKSVCARVRKAEGKTYQLIDQDGKLPPVPFYPIVR